MKKISTLIILLLASLSVMAQYPSQTQSSPYTAVQDTNVYRINESDVKRFITAMNTMNLTKADFAWMKNHPYESNKNAEVYQRVQKSILGAGFKDYLEYSKVAQRTAIVYAYDKNGGVSSEQEKQMEEAANNPNIPDQYKEQIRQQVKMLKKQQPVPSEIQSITPHKKELDAIFAKYSSEG